MKTSQQYPLEIDSVFVPGSTGRIGMTFCPGKKQQGAMTGSWDRDLVVDLEAIRAWGATVIVNLIEDHEMTDLNVQDTAQHVPADIAYLRLPIPDFGVPDSGWHAQWQIEAPALLARLRAGESVVLHCKGGLGRTGMIAARMLVELGCTAQEAITSVRKARSGTIETREQEAYVEAIQHG